MEVYGFDWDEANQEHCGKHDVSLTEIEQAFANGPLVLADDSGSAETRYNAVGRNDRGRHLFVLYTFCEIGGRALIRRISARYMHAKEVRIYERTKGA